jgi:RNA polymerase sigma factor (sigma-70 family)
MATSPMSWVIRHLCNTARLRDGADRTDGQLLEGFVSRRESAALAVLVERHATMVWSVCRRLLQNHHDAEDAFQATFLVLVRKASSVVPREMLPNWLYGVAHQTALKARATLAKRRERERQVAAMPEPEAVRRHELWPELGPALDAELSRLPDKYRVAIVLCDLEGKTRREAAHQLGIPDGTFSARLARGRTMLAKRLTRHGFAVAGGTVAAVLSQHAALGCVPATVLASTIKTTSLFAVGQAAGRISAQVAALMEGVLKAMLMIKLKKMTYVLLVLGIVAFCGRLSLREMAAAQQGPGEKRPAAGQRESNQGAAPSVAKTEAKTDKEKLQGTWQNVMGFYGEYPSVPGIGSGNIKGTLDIVIDGDTWAGWTQDGKKATTTFRIDATKTPKTFDIKDRAGGHHALGIYMLGEDDLVICICGGTKQVRPAKFLIEDQAHSLIIYKRVGVGKKGTDTAKTDIEEWLETLYKQTGLPSKAEKEEKEPAKFDKELQGGWEVIACEKNGKILSKEEWKKEFGFSGFVFFGKLCSWESRVDESKPFPKTSMEMQFRLDTTKNPRWIDFLLPGGKDEGLPQGIYVIEKDELRLAIDYPGRRPSTFDANATTLVLTLKRSRP